MDRLGVGKGDGIGERVEWEKCEMRLGVGGSSREGRSKQFRKYFGHRFLMDMDKVKGGVHTDFQIWV